MSASIDIYLYPPVLVCLGYKFLFVNARGAYVSCRQYTKYLFEKGGAICIVSVFFQRYF